MSVSAGRVVRLGVPDSRLRFGEEPKAPGAWAGRRVLSLDERPAFELSFWCGTCQFLFRRLEGANDTLSLDDLQTRLSDGLCGFDDEVIGAFAQLLPEDDYLPLLLTAVPRLTMPSGPGDYFAQEQVVTWGLSSFWGLPEYPATPYYRTYQTRVTETAHLFEFIVPMTPPTWDNPARVAEHAHRLSGSAAPTAVAVATLDVCAPAVDAQSVDYFEHWGLTHFLLDGHHKVHAAAELGRPLQLLSFVAMGASLATPEQTGALSNLRAQQDETRPPSPR
jgi:hypothetical protein